MFNGDSFGADCPTNWEEIADYLNDKYRELYGDVEDSDLAERLWDDYCMGHLADAPEAIF